MRFLILNIILFFAVNCKAQDSSFVLGNEAYASGDYKTALNEYNKIVGSEAMSAALFYNLGNTYYKLNDLGKAIWAYEKSLKINPANENTLFNLKLVNKETFDKLITHESGILNWFKKNIFSFSYNFWAYISIVISILFSFFLYLFFTTKKQKIKNGSLTASFGSLFFLILTFVFAFYHKSTIVDKSEAILLDELVDVRLSPDSNEPSDFSLHEGTRVTLLRSNENWSEIDVNGNVGWIEKSTYWEF